MKLQHWVLSSLAAAALAACGGGGSPAPAAVVVPPVVTPPVIPVPPPYTITPEIVKASYVAGYPTSVTLTARQTVAFTGLVYIKATIDADVLNPEVAITPLPDATATIVVKTSASAKPGHYTGNITVNVCTDALCASNLGGSPFKLPYEIDVISPDGGVVVMNPSVLTPLIGAGDWETFQGNAQHTGYVPVTLAPSAFNARWKWTAPAVGGQMLPPSTIATGAGMIYLSTGNSFSPKGSSYVAAYSELDGSKIWSHSFDDLRWPSTNPPAFSNGKIYISAGSQESTAMFAFDAGQGTQLFKSVMASQWEHYLAPTVFGGSVYSDGGSYGGLYSFDTMTGTRNYSTSLQQYDGWTPAVDASALYTYVGGALQMIDRVAGTVSGSISDPNYSWNGYTTSGAPVIGADGLVLAGNLSNSSSNAIVGFDVLAKNVRWSAQGAYSGNPAYVDGTVFAANNSNSMLEARRGTDGGIVWSWTAPADDHHFVSDVLVTKNLVFASTDKTTYAIDRASHVQVWSYKAGGKLALSANGILYIESGTGIVAINLK